MTPEKLFQLSQRLGIRLSVHAGELVVDAPNCAPNAWLAAELSVHKTELMALLGSREQDVTQDEQRRLDEYAAEITAWLRCPTCCSYDIALIPTAKPPHWGELRCMVCGVFCGWAPTPPWLAAEWVMPFGEHKGQTLTQIAETERGRSYLEWAGATMRKPRIREMITYFLDHIYGKPRSSAGAATPTLAVSAVAAGDKDEIPF